MRQEEKETLEFIDGAIFDGWEALDWLRLKYEGEKETQPSDMEQAYLMASGKFLYSIAQSMQYIARILTDIRDNQP